MKKTFALILATGTLFLAGCCTERHCGRWEYKTVTVTSDSDDQINKLAVEGWKVESFTAMSSSNGSLTKVYLLKKPKRSL